MRRARRILLACIFGAAALLTAPLSALATPYNYVSYNVRLMAVQAPNSGQTPAGVAADSLRSSAPLPTRVELYATIDNGPNYQGLGGASAVAFASAEAGVLRVYSRADAQAVAQPTTNVGATAVSEAFAEFRDGVVFTAGQAVYQNLLVVSGTLLLDGDMFGVGPVSAEVHVGGTGLNSQNVSAEWIGDIIGRQKSATGVYSPWVPGDPVAIPFSFSVYSGQATELNYWLQTRTGTSAAFAPCPSFGGLCNNVQAESNSVEAGYDHSLTWGGVSVTDWFGTPVGFSVSSISGFDYSIAHPVPEAGAAVLLAAGLGVLGWISRRRGSA